MAEEFEALLRRIDAQILRYEKQLVELRAQREAVEAMLKQKRVPSRP